MKVFYFFIFTFCLLSVLFAQQQDSVKMKLAADSISVSKSKQSLWYLSLDYGGSNITESTDFSACIGASVSAEFGHNLFTARVVHDQGVNLATPNPMVFDAGLLYGYGIHNTLWFENTSVGLAYTATTKRIFVRQDTIFPQNNVYRGELFRGIGFAWQAELFSKFSDSSSAGLGITLCGNINKSLPFWMILFSLKFGNY